MSSKNFHLWEITSITSIISNPPMGFVAGKPSHFFSLRPELFATAPEAENWEIGPMPLAPLMAL
jgi:hypothetical protein